MSLQLLRRRGRKNTDVDDAVEEVQEVAEEFEAPPISDAKTQATSAAGAKAATVLLWGALLAGPAALGVFGYSYMQGEGPVPVQTEQVVDRSGEQAVAGEFATRVVVAWLTATRGEATELAGLVEGADTAALQGDPLEADQVSVAGIESAGPGVWSVTVAATVTDSEGEPQRRYLQVPVMVSGDAVTALALPSVVSPPMIAAPPASAYRHAVPASSSINTTVSGFLSAYVAGSGDLSRYLTPGVEDIIAVTPAPFTEVQLVDLRAASSVDANGTPEDGEELQVLVVVTGTVSADHSLTGTYALSLTARAGRWEISSINPAPEVRDTSQTPGTEDSVPGEPSPTGEGSTPTSDDSPSTESP